MIYAWESVEDSYYPFGFFPEQAVGLYFDILHVEQTVEGWHGILMVWWAPSEDDMTDEPAGFSMVNEQVFDAKYDAVRWVETQDQQRAAQDSDLQEMLEAI